MGMILRIASSRIVGQGDIVGRSGYFSLNLSANSVMRGRLDARRTLKSLVADLRLSYFKWYNYCEHLKYNFKTFSVEGLSSELLKDFEYIHTQILPKSNPNRIITANDIESFQRDHSPCCEYELTNGHDFIKRFCHHLRINDLIHRQENENSIRNRLHPCFRLEAFVQTQLYQDISDWENANGSNILKKPN